MITVIGEALIDLVPASDATTWRAPPGGSALNVAIGAARLGHPTALMARLFSDGFGQQLRRHVSRNGVDLVAAPEADEPTTVAVAAPAAAGPRRSSLYLQGTADWQWSIAGLARIPAATTVVHLGSLACCIAPGAARILRAAVRQRRRGALVCVDPSVCREVMGTPGRGRLLVERMVLSADVVKASTEDIAWLYPGRALADVAGHWLGLGPELAVITCGGDGAMALQRRGRPELRAAGRRPAYGDRARPRSARPPQARYRALARVAVRAGQRRHLRVPATAADLGVRAPESVIGARARSACLRLVNDSTGNVSDSLIDPALRSA